MRLWVCSLILLFMSPAIETNGEKKNVLIYNPYLGYYHTKFMATIANELHEAGYNVTVLDSIVNSNFVPASVHPNITVLEVDQHNITREIANNGLSSDVGLKAFWDEQPFEKKFLGFFTFYNRVGNFSNMLRHQCEQILNSTALEKLKETKFDLAITEAFDLCGVGIFHTLKPSRTMLASSVPLHEHLGEILGLPKSFDAIPTKFSLSTPPDLRKNFDPFSSRTVIANAIESAIFGQEMFGYLEKFENDVFEHKDATFPGLKTLLRKAHSLIENVHPLLDLNKPTLNWIIPVGGITYQTTLFDAITQENRSNEREIEMEIKKEKDSNKKIVLVSFGTVMDTNTMKNSTKSNIFDAFKEVSDASFFWKANLSEFMPDYGGKLPDNVKIYDWLPQKKLLDSGKIDLFISHMGIGSMTEAAYSGVPLLSVPIFVDQHYNFVCASRLGIARFVDKINLASDPNSLTSVIKDALVDTNLRNKSILLKNKLKSYGDQRLRMVEHIKFILSLPPDTESIAFNNNHNGFNFALSIQSVTHLIPRNAIGIVNFVHLCLSLPIAIQLMGRIRRKLLWLTEYGIVEISIIVCQSFCLSIMWNYICLSITVSIPYAIACYVHPNFIQDVPEILLKMCLYFMNYSSYYLVLLLVSTFIFCISNNFNHDYCALFILVAQCICILHILFTVDMTLYIIILLFLYYVCLGFAGYRYIIEKYKKD